MWSTALTLLIVGLLVYGFIEAAAFMIDEDEE
jgi:hypothetical protein